MKFRKLPVVIDAVSVQSVLSDPQLESWVAEGFVKGILHAYTECIIVNTLEGRMRAEADDWIIRGVNQELYPIKPEIFLATYERVEG